MSDEVTRQAAEAQAERNVSREHYDWMVNDRDEWKECADTLEGTVQRMTVEIQRLTAERDAARAERDVAEREWTECRAQVSQLRREYDAERAEVEATREERDAAREERDAARAEAEGLRADLLAHPPETHTELAVERKRHLELSEEYDRQQIIITKLDDALRRTENALKTAQAKHIDPRLKGLLSVLSRTASEAEEMLS